MSSFFVWLSTVGQLWASLVTGGIIVALVWIIFVILKRPVPRGLSIGMATFFMLWAMFQTWNTEHQKTIKLEAQNHLVAPVSEDLNLRPENGQEGFKEKTPSVPPVHGSRPDGLSQFMGSWIGSYVCSKHPGTLEWVISANDNGGVEVRETYHANFKWPVGTRSGKVFYSGALKRGKLELATQAFGGYEVELTSSENDPQSMTGVYLNKPGCTDLSFHR